MSPAPKILFVNKGLTSKSLSRSDGREKSRIFSHVQQPSKGRLPLSSPEALTIIDSSSNSSSETCDDAGPSEKVAGRTLKSRSSQTLRDKSVRKNTAQRDSTLPLLCANIGKLDLFGTTSAPITDYMSQVLGFCPSARYCSEMGISVNKQKDSGTLLDRIFPSKILADISRQTTLSYATTNVVALNAILCTASGALYMHLGDARHAYHAMYFKGQAIHHLKQELNRPGVDSICISTLYAVSLLLYIECLQGDMKAIEAHISGLNQLAGLVQGVRESPLPVLSTILSFSYYCSAMLGTRPVLEPLSTATSADLSTITASALSISGNESIGSRFFDPMNAAVVGPDLLRIVSNQMTVLMFKEQCANRQVDPTYDEIHHIYNIDMETDYQLLAMPFDIGTGLALSPIQNAVRLALYIHTQPIISVAKPNAAFSRSLTMQLKAALERTDLSSLWEPNHDLLLWLLFVGAQISYEQVEWSWFVSHIAMLVNPLDLYDISDLETLLKGFYYDARTSDQTMRNVWRDADSILCVT